MFHQKRTRKRKRNSSTILTRSKKKRKEAISEKIHYVEKLNNILQSEDFIEKLKKIAEFEEENEFQTFFELELELAKYFSREDSNSLSELKLRLLVKIEDVFRERILMFLLRDEDDVKNLEEAEKIIELLFESNEYDKRIVNSLMKITIGLLEVLKKKKTKKEIVYVTHEKLVSQHGCDNDEAIIINSRIDLARFYKEKSENKKALDIITQKIIDVEGINVFQKESALIMLFSLYNDDKDTKNRKEAKKFLIQLISQYIGRNRLNEARVIFIPNENYFEKVELDYLMFKAKLEENPVNAAKWYFKIGVWYEIANDFPKAVKYYEEVVKNDCNRVDAHEVLLRIEEDIIHKDKPAIGIVINRCLKIVDICKRKNLLSKEEEYVLKAYNLDKTNLIVLDKYLEFLIRKKDYVKFRELSKNNSSKVLLERFDLQHKKSDNLEKELVSLQKEQKKIQEKIDFNLLMLPVNYKDVQKKFTEEVKTFEKKFMLNKIEWTLTIKPVGNYISIHIQNKNKFTVVTRFFVKLGRKKFSNFIQFKENDSYGDDKFCEKGKFKEMATYYRPIKLDFLEFFIGKSFFLDLTVCRNEKYTKNRRRGYYNEREGKLKKKYELVFIQENV